MKAPAIIIVLIIFTGLCFGQNAKKYYKTGEKFKLAKEYKSAIDQYTLSIQLDPALSSAYLSRAACYEKTDSLNKALEDYRKLKALKVSKKNYSYYIDAATLCYRFELYDEGIDFLKNVLDLPKLKKDAYTLQTKIKIAQKLYDDAISSANTAIEIEDNSILHFLKATAYERKENLDNAEKEYILSVSKNSKNIEALTALAYLQLRVDKLDDAFKNAGKLISIDDKNKDGYYIRSQVYVKKMDYPNAINDISRTIMMYPDDKNLFFIRGTYYQNFTQHQNAINDFNKAILLDENYLEAYYKRAYSYEQIANYEKAIGDYKKLLALSGDDKNADELMKEAKQKLFELNKESNKPQIVITEPTPDKHGMVHIPRNSDEINIKGIVIDESDISSIQVNKVNVQFGKGDKGIEFDAKISTSNIDSFLVVAEDVYKNKQEMSYSIVRTEINPPVVNLIAPYASDDAEIFLDKDSPNIFIEGIVTDESLINSIIIDGVLASFKVDEANPHFIATISINNKNSFTVTAKDIYGNQTDQTYTINREGISLLENNPMGKTWAIFIENSDYINFPSLDGPSRDVNLMRSALLGYDIQNIIHKKNLSKEDMERFFSIDLRDLVKGNGVRSLLIWYAGHGKFINETGYWIPVDAKREDEFSYYSINNLKASLQSYENLVNHTLLITDACESGPTFYQAMRGNMVERSCGDWEATKLKSYQVFTSAGYELAIDNSQFTKTFANMLANNPNSCIPIESIVLKVTQAVSQNNQQKPQFGKISGLADEDGTFFFINK